MSIFRLLQQLGRRVSRGDRPSTPRERPEFDEPEEPTSFLSSRPPEVPEKFKKESLSGPLRRQEAITPPSQDLVRTQAVQEPLTTGGKNPEFGSTLYDFVALSRFKNNPRKPKEWANELYNEKLRKNFKNPNLNDVRQTVSLDELADSGIAQYDKQGNLIGGFLKHADEYATDVRRDDLLAIIKKSPGVNLKVSEFAPVVRLPKTVDSFLETSEAITKEAQDNLSRYSKYDANTQTPASMELTRLNIRLKTLYSNIEDARANNVGTHEASTLEKLGKSVDLMRKNIVSLSRYDDLLQGSNTVVNPRVLEKFLNQAEILDKQIKQSVVKSPRYGVAHPSYILGGAEEYGEAVVSSSIPKDLIPGKISYSTSHYEDIHNPTVFFRYSIRSLKGDPNKKVLSIDEVQNDIDKSNRGNRDINRFLEEGETHQSLNTKSNPYTVDAMLSIEKDVYAKNLEELKRISDKGSYRTVEDVESFRKIKRRNDALEGSTLKEFEAGLKNAPFTYSPFQRPEDYADLAIKQAVKIAIKRGDVSHVVVNPADGHHNLIRDNTKFNLKFYGTASGKESKVATSADHKKAFESQQKIAKRKIKEFKEELEDANQTYDAASRKDMIMQIKKAEEFLKQKQPGFHSNIGRKGKVGVYEGREKSFLNPKATSVMGKAFKNFAKNQYGAKPDDVGTFEIAKSDPTKQFKLVYKPDKAMSIEGITGSGADLDLLEMHDDAFSTLEAAKTAKGQSKRSVEVKQVMDIDPNNYYKAYGIKITPEMANKPFKLYKKEGGLVVNSN